MKHKIKKGFALLKKVIRSEAFRARVAYSFMNNYINVNKKTILYESYHGKSMTGNPYALFLSLVEDRRFKNFTHIWILTNPIFVTQWNQQNIKFIKRNSLKHVIYLLKSKYLINNTTFLPHVNIKDDQVYINTWHGTPFKTLGKDVKFSYGNSRNVCKNLLQTNFFISPNRYTTEIFLKSNDVDTLYSGEIIENGYPRNDLLFLSQEKKEKLFITLGLNNEKKVLLYAPTFRGSHLDSKNCDNIFLSFIKMLESSFQEDYNILIKLHHINYGNDLSIKLVPETCDTNELLSITDILITDYSSIAFDFLLLKKPIIHYVFDLEEYIDNRGLYLEIEDMPGVFCKTENSVKKELISIDSFMKDRKDKYNKAIERFCKHDDGLVSKKIINAIFLDKVDNVNIYNITKNNKKKVLIYGGAFLNNGVTASLVALLSNISYKDYEIYLISTINVKGNDFLRTMDRIPKSVKLIYISESVTKLFQPLYKRININRLEKLFKEENYTFFGNTKFDIAIDYSGYGSYWACMIAFSTAKLKCIYIHSDIKSESIRRAHLTNYSLLNNLYKDCYDKLITVSESSYLANKNNFLELTHKFFNVNNPIDAKKIIELSKQTSCMWNNQIDTDKINFINIARYSVEKGQDRLIEAFFKLVQLNQEVHLYLVGHGPMHQNLKLSIKKLKLEKHITLTDNLDNPFPLLASCDCFVLSSHYEGQGLVLLESMVLGIPCISTDIPGPQSVLKDGKGLLVEDSVEGLRNGMEKFIKGKVPIKVFDNKKYTNNAMRSFYNAIN